MSAASTDPHLDVFTTAQVRGFDRRAIDELGIAGFELMQRAAAAALDVVRQRWPEARKLAIYCGGGNNGGDGYVLAALAAAAGLEPVAIAVSNPADLGGDAGEAFRLAEATAGVGIVSFAQDQGRAAVAADVIVDALLGTGLERDVAGAVGDAVARINASASPVLAIDLPTGLDSDTGRVRGTAVEATATVTFVGFKSGLYLGEGPAHCGAVEFSGLGLPAAAYAAAAPVLRRIDAGLPRRLLKSRSRMSHKGMNGRVLIVGGSVGMPGAARLAAEAALRVGAGLVHAAVAPASVGPVLAGRPEIMCRGVDTAADIADWAEAADVVVLGPGLGQADRGRELAAAVLAVGKPLVVDADGLNYLAMHPDCHSDRVLTPHPGEAARLLSCSTGEIQRGRAEAVRRIARTYGGIAVLKGSCSLVAGPDGEDGPVAVCDAGNPGMASGGMGDVLAGVIAGLIAQFGLTREVVECGVFVHARAGDAAAAAGGERGLLASDLFADLRRQVNPG